MANKIILKKSSVAAKVPLTTDLEYGELAINYADGKLYYKKSDNTIDEFISAGGTSEVISVDGNTGIVTSAQLLTAIKKEDGSGSGLDADLLDGQDSSYYAASSSLTNYLPLSGGTLTGTLNLAANGLVAGTNQLVITGGNIGVGTASPTSKLEINGSLKHNGLDLTEGSNIDQITTITKSITLTTDWQDTGIKSTDLTTGSYIVQLYANDIGSGGTNSNEYYSGTMSWYAGDTNSSVELPTDEIVLHRAGGSGDGALYLRTYRTATADPDNLKLQIYSNTPNASAANYVFKFRRVI
jgi:hypothetical protein